MLKRLISMLVGIIILIVVMTVSNELIFNISVAIISILGLYEFYNAMAQVGIKPIKWVRLFKCSFTGYTSIHKH